MAKKHKDPTDKDYTRLGKALEQVLLQNNLQVSRHWKQFVLMSFVRGLFVGLGTIVGATLLVTIVIWLLNAFGGLPLIGEWFETIQRSLQSGADQPI